jgi:hypothetical protein
VPEETVPLNPFYEWIGKEQQHLREMKTMLHPAVFSPAMQMIHGVAELHATDKPALCPEHEGGLRFCWQEDQDTPLDTPIRRRCRSALLPEGELVPDPPGLVGREELVWMTKPCQCWTAGKDPSFHL